MAYLFTYSTDEDDSDLDTRPESPVLNFENYCKEVSQMNQKVEHFFNEVSTVPFLYNYKYHLPPTIEDLSDPPYLEHPEQHFTHVLDDKSIRRVQAGIGRVPDFRSCNLTKRYALDDDELKTLFLLAEKWIEIAHLGRLHYVNDLCWVASKIIDFQYNYPTLKKCI